jgi:hypothetical protein
MSPAQAAQVANAAQVTQALRPTVSVVIPAYSDERWTQLHEAVASALAQTYPATEVIVAVDHNPGLLSRARRELTDVVVIPSTGARGASGTRNSGVARSSGEIIAFLDDDACAAPDWLETLVVHFADPAIAGVGGRVDPLWATARPRWFPGEFDWALGASYSGMPTTTARVRNVWTNNMALRRSAFDAAGGFREDFGKVGGVCRPEDTDLCLRVTSGSWLYVPAGAVGHWVPAERATFRYFLRRCFEEGQGKAGIAVVEGAATGTSAERSYTARVLPAAVGRGLAETVTGDGAGALRSAAIVSGFCTAAAGFAVGCVSAATSRWSASRAANQDPEVSR